MTFYSSWLSRAITAYGFRSRLRLAFALARSLLALGAASLRASWSAGREDFAKARWSSAALNGMLSSELRSKARFWAIGALACSVAALAPLPMPSDADLGVEQAQNPLSALSAEGAESMEAHAPPSAARARPIQTISASFSLPAEEPTERHLATRSGARSFTVALAAPDQQEGPELDADDSISFFLWLAALFMASCSGQLWLSERQARFKPELPARLADIMRARARRAARAQHDVERLSQRSSRLKKALSRRKP